MTSHYKRKIIIARCDKNGKILGSIERWEAHEKGVLHRAFSVALKYKDFYIVQLRKHPVFDGVLDVSSSSHQIYDEKTGNLQHTVEAAVSTLLREWKIKESHFIGEPKVTGTVYYKSKDKNSIYTEHEVDDVVEISLKKIPEPNLEYAYGMSLMTKNDLLKNKRVNSNLAPWVIKMLDSNLL